MQRVCNGVFAVVLNMVRLHKVKSIDILATRGGIIKNLKLQDKN